MAIVCGAPTTLPNVKSGSSRMTAPLLLLLFSSDELNDELGPKCPSGFLYPIQRIYFPFSDVYILVGFYCLGYMIIIIC